MTNSTKTFSDPKVFLKASIGQTYFKCRTPNCKCKKGHPHSAHYLSYRKSGKTHTVHIPKALVKEIRRMCQNWKRFNGQLEVETHNSIKAILSHYKKEQGKE